MWKGFTQWKKTGKTSANCPSHRQPYLMPAASPLSPEPPSFFEAHRKGQDGPPGFPVHT